jgi:DNA modification methylase
MQEKGVVLDPYSGSGTTGLAAKLLGHDYIGFDLPDEYHDMARKRLDNHSKTDLKKFTEECGVEVSSDTDVFNLAGA